MERVELNQFSFGLPSVSKFFSNRVKSMKKPLRIIDSFVLEERLLKKPAQLIKTQEAALLGMASMMRMRDLETGYHIERTQSYMNVLAEETQRLDKKHYKIGKNMRALLYHSAPLHDIGKVAIPDEILRKSGLLNSCERAIMETHTEKGRSIIQEVEEILGTNSFLQTTREIAYSHHEKWDGSGYPLGLSETKIPLSARLMAIADVYDALISKRSYKEAFSHRDSVEIIEQGASVHFDPTLVDAFLHIRDHFRQIADRFANNRMQQQVLLAA